MSMCSPRRRPLSCSRELYVFYWVVLCLTNEGSGVCIHTSKSSSSWWIRTNPSPCLNLSTFIDRMVGPEFLGHSEQGRQPTVRNIGALRAVTNVMGIYKPLYNMLHWIDK